MNIVYAKWHRMCFRIRIRSLFSWTDCTGTPRHDFLTAHVHKKGNFIILLLSYNSHTMNINFCHCNSLSNRYPRNNGAFLLHLVKEHHNSCLVQPLLRMGPVDVATSTISSSTTNNNTTVTTARMQPIATTATTAYINAMLTSCHLLEEEEYTRRLRVSSLWSKTSLTRRRTNWRWWGQQW